MAAAARTDTPSVDTVAAVSLGDYHLFSLKLSEQLLKLSNILFRPEGDEGGKNDGTLEGDARHVAEMRMELHRIALGSVYESMLEKRHTQVKMIRAEEASELKEDEGIVKAIREEWQRVAECANAVSHLSSTIPAAETKRLRCSRQTHQAQTEQGSGDLFKKQIEKLNKDEADLESSVQGRSGSRLWSIAADRGWQGALDGLGGEGQGGAKGRLTNGAAAAGAKKARQERVREQIQAIAKSAPAQGEQEVEQDEEEEREAAAQVQAQGQEDTDEDFTEQPSKSADQASAGPSLTTLAQLDSSSSNSVQNTLFAPYYFYISRECPRGMLEFVLRCFGASSAQIGWDSLSGGAGSAFDESDERITHHIVDRPPHARFTRDHGGKRAYVQPQWVVDCVNAKKLLATGPYEPGKTLPPHLSPFVDNEAVKRRGGYVPAEGGEVQESMQEDEEQGESADEDEDDEEEEEEEEADGQAAVEEDRPTLSALLADPTNTELLSAAELEAEQAGGEDALGALHRAHEAALKKAGHGKKTSSTAKKGAEDADEEEAKKMAKMLMSNKQRKLYNKVSLGAGRRGEERERLERKKMALQKDKSRATKKKV
ncbi:hypothetical protein L7F22_056479 [Adiantum nelumboides]|nr:hypothetical protein [Adiantum nelumboides]